MQNILSVHDLLSKADAMEAYRRMLGVEDWRIKRDFNPNGMKMDSWCGMYDFFKIFFPTLSRTNLRSMLIKYRKEYHD